jgi:hypothetical protein
LDDSFIEKPLARRFMPVTFEDIVRRAKKPATNKHWGDVEHGTELSS